MIRTQQWHRMVTEDEVKAYRYRPVLLARGEGVRANVQACVENPRVWRFFHSKRDSKVFVDDVVVPDPTPGAIAHLLNTQEPKELTGRGPPWIGTNRGGMI